MRNVLFLSILVVVTSFFFAIFGFTRWSEEPISLSEKSIFVLKPGQVFSEVSAQLIDQGVDIEPLLFYALAKIKRVEGSLRAGTYELPLRISPSRLLEMLSKGEVKLYEFRINEGWNFKQLATGLRADENVSYTIDGLSSRALRERLNIEYPYIEGVFFPDTYFFESGTEDLDILSRAHETMNQKVTAIWQQFNSERYDLESPSDLLVLASLIEKETGYDEDRYIISQVFHERLRRKMRLQTDPSVIFALGDKFDGNLTRRNLRIDSPYNTYRKRGLPPTPASYPSEASLSAAANPTNSEYLYFVARGDGSSQFSKTLREHNAAVRKYQLNR